MEEKRTIIVTGAGRSGTSAVARVLHESGVSMGCDLAGPDESNSTGYYEEIPVIRVNDHILSAASPDRDLALHPDRPQAGRRIEASFSQAAPSRSEVLAAAQPQEAEIGRLAAGLPGVGGWKDPRFCWTLEAWLPHLPSKPRLIVCLRSPEDGARSTMRYFGLVDDAARESVYQLWADQYERLLEFVADFRLEATCVEYPALIEDPEPSVERLSAFVGRPLRSQYVNPSLRNHATDVPERFTGLYARVLELGAPKPQT